MTEYQAAVQFTFSSPSNSKQISESLEPIQQNEFFSSISQDLKTKIENYTKANVKHDIFLFIEPQIPAVLLSEVELSKVAPKASSIHLTSQISMNEKSRSILNALPHSDNDSKADFKQINLYCRNQTGDLCISAKKVMQTTSISIDSSFSVNHNGSIHIIMMDYVQGEDLNELHINDLSDYLSKITETCQSFDAYYLGNAVTIDPIKNGLLMSSAIFQGLLVLLIVMVAAGLTICCAFSVQSPDELGETPKDSSYSKHNKEE